MKWEIFSGEKKNNMPVTMKADGDGKEKNNSSSSSREHKIPNKNATKNEMEKLLSQYTPK